MEKYEEALKNFELLEVALKTESPYERTLMEEFIEIEDVRIAIEAFKIILNTYEVTE